VFPVMREILGHVRRFYEDDLAVIELVMDGDSLDGYEANVRDITTRLTAMGLLESGASGFRPTNLLAMAWEADGRVVKVPKRLIRVPLSDILRDGEGETVEFKSSFRVPTGADIPERVLITEVLTSIAAFANNLGGCLLIGVDD